MNYKNTLIAVLLLASLLFSLFTISVASSEKISLSARSAALYEPSTDTFLIEKNSKIRLPMASTTKIMTAVVALENANLTDTVTVDERSAGIEGSSAYLSVGDEYTLHDMLYALMLASANDAATAIACSVSGSVDSFVELMNKKCEALSLVDTHFENPSGLDANEHYTTASDLAKLTAYALKNDTFRQLCSTYKKSIYYNDKVRNFVNHNKLLKQYPDAIGVKTGFTKKSGRCLVSAAERNGVTLIGVTLDAPNDWQDHKKMLDYGFDTLEERLLAAPNEFRFEIPLLFSDDKSIIAQNTDEYKLILPKTSKITNEVLLPPYLVKPIKQGEILGKIIFRADGKIIGDLDLVAQKNVELDKKHIFH